MASKNKDNNEEEKKEKWADVYEDFKFVIHGGKVQCKYCKSEGDIIIPETPTTVMLQDKPWATIAHNNGKVNLNFPDVCNHPSQKKLFQPPPPCKAVISLGEWKNYSDTKVNDDNALLKKSTIICNVSKEAIKITDSGQRAELTDVALRVRAAPEIVSVEWMDAPVEKEIEKTVIGDKVNIRVEVMYFNVGDMVNVLVEKNNNGKIENKVFTGQVYSAKYAKLKEPITVESATSYTIKSVSGDNVKTAFNVKLKIDCCCGISQDDDGWLSGNGIRKEQIDFGLHQSDMNRRTVKAIIIHNTEGPTLQSAFTGIPYSKDEANFYIDNGKIPTGGYDANTDGQITQIASLKHNTNHLGPTRPKGKKLGLSNTNTIGIEFVGNRTKASSTGDYPFDIDAPKGPRVSWDAPTQKQIESGVRLVKCLLKKYNLSASDIYWHDDVSPKQGGEGEDVYKQIIKQL